MQMTIGWRKLFVIILLIELAEYHVFIYLFFFFLLICGLDGPSVFIMLVTIV